MLGVAPVGTKLGHVVRAAAPYFVCALILVAILNLFPTLALYLRNHMPSSQGAKGRQGSRFGAAKKETP